MSKQAIGVVGLAVMGRNLALNIESRGHAVSVYNRSREKTDDLMAEAGCLYHTSWIIDDQPWPINVRGGQKFIFVPYTGQTNDAGMLAWNREADYFQQMIKDQFDTLYREGAENGRVMCLSLHPHNIGRPNAAKHLDEALRHILGHDGVWATTADDIAEYYLANYYDQVKSWIAERNARVTE